MKLLIKFPTRGRPEKALPLLEKYRDMLSGKHEVFFLVTLDENDGSMNNSLVANRLARLCKGRTGVKGICCVGKSGTKVQAINADMGAAPPDWDVMLLASDDMVPQMQGYDDVIFEQMCSHHPDLDGALWFFDGYTTKVCTLVIMGKPYYERFNYIYHPDYLSLFCDNEWTEVAQAHKKLPYIECIIIKHEHFANCRGIHCDALYKKNESFWDQDEALFCARRDAGFWLGRGHAC